MQTGKIEMEVVALTRATFTASIGLNKHVKKISPVNIASCPCGAD